MSSKKVSSKASKAPAKKPAAKPAKKAAPAKPAAKAPAKKPAAKPAKKVVPAKPAKAPAKKPAVKVPAKPAKAPAKPAKPAPKAKDSKKPAPKAAPAKKPVAKPAPKAAAKPAPEAAPAKKPVAKPAPKAAAKPESKTAEKPAKAETKVAQAKKPVDKTPAKVETEAVVKASAKPVEVEQEAPAVEKKPKNAPDYAYAVLLQGVKRLSKTIMFVKVDESEDRSNKKKMSSDVKNLDMKPTSAIRHKSSLAEETQEELTERILKELEEQNKMFEREAATQMCTRCNRNLVSPEFWVDKHLGFCEECAAILKLGQSKEARKVEYQLGAMDGDSLDEEDDDIIGPDADDLKAAEEDLAEMED